MNVKEVPPYSILWCSHGEHRYYYADGQANLDKLEQRFVLSAPDLIECTVDGEYEWICLDPLLIEETFKIANVIRIMRCPECSYWFPEDNFSIDESTSWDCENCGENHETRQDALDCCGSEDDEVSYTDLDTTVSEIPTLPEPLKAKILAQDMTESLQRIHNAVTALQQKMPSITITSN